MKITYSESRSRVILVRNNEDLKYLPAKRIDESNPFIHVLGDIVSVHDRVHLKLDPEFLAQVP